MDRPAQKAVAGDVCGRRFLAWLSQTRDRLVNHALCAGRDGRWNTSCRGGNIEHPTSNIEHPTSNIEHPTSNIQHPTSNIQHPTSNIQHPTSNIQHPTSNMDKLVRRILEKFGAEG
jgi:hypothetical protein